MKFTNILHVKSLVNIYKSNIQKNSMEVKKIRKEGNQKKITIPTKSDLKIGDYVIVTKLETSAIPQRITEAPSVLKQDE